MPEYCVERISKILNIDKKAINGSRILTLGVAYKQDIDDYRESPALRVIDLLGKEGAIVDYYDPFVNEYNFTEKYLRDSKKLMSTCLKNTI
jgi:UDP-N-acetyl-D-glucosamine dehydrogenase